MTDVILRLSNLNVEFPVFGGISGLFNTITFFSNLNLENILQNIPVKEYYDTLNNSIFSTIHYLNYFELG